MQRDDFNQVLDRGAPEGRHVAGAPDLWVRGADPGGVSARDPRGGELIPVIGPDAFHFSVLILLGIITLAEVIRTVWR